MASIVADVKAEREHVAAERLAMSDSIRMELEARMEDEKRALKVNR